MYRIDLARAKFAVYRYHLRFKSYQHVAQIALQKNGGGIAPAFGKHRYVFVQLGHKVGCLGIGAAAFAYLSPSSQVGHAPIATGLGVDDHDLNARTGQVVPVFDPFGVFIAHQKQHGRTGGRCVVREALSPVFRHHAIGG